MMGRGWGRAARAGAAALALAGLSGCAAVSALSGAATPLDAYAPTPLAGSGEVRGTRQIVVERPSASGAIATDRILVKPNRLQAAYLPGARWTDPAPDLVQTLLVQSLQASGAFRLVGRDSLGLFPDLRLLSEVRAFQAEPGPVGGAPYVVRVAITLTLVREMDAAVLGTRNFAASAEAASDAPLALASAFDAATQAVLREAVAWTARAGAGGV